MSLCVCFTVGVGESCSLRPCLVISGTIKFPDTVENDVAAEAHGKFEAVRQHLKAAEMWNG